MEKTMENHLVDPTEKSENAESSENVTDKRNQKYITPNNRLTIIAPLQIQNFSKCSSTFFGFFRKFYEQALASPPLEAAAAGF